MRAGSNWRHLNGLSLGMMGDPVRCLPKVVHPDVAALKLQHNHHDRSRLDGVLHERHQAVGRGIRHPPHPDAPDGTAAYLGGNDHQGLLAEVPASAARLDPADDGLVHLDLRRDPIPAGPHHRAAELVQPRPGRAVTAQTEDALQAQGAGAVLLANHPPDRPKPERQRGTSALEDRARHHRRLVPTDRAHPESSPGGPRLGAIARGAHEAPPPTETRQVLAARLLGHEALFELLECARVLLHSPNHYRLGSLESRTYLHKS